MNNETRASESATTGARGPSRRTLVRTAAWSVPVISTVAAAPAFAAASDVFVVTSSAGIDNGRNRIDVTVNIANTAAGSLSASGVVVSFTSFTLPAGVAIGTASILSPPTGWQVTDGLANGLPYEVTYQSSIPNPGSTSVTIRFNFSDKPDGGQTVSIAGAVTIPNFTANPPSFSASATA